MQTFTQPLISPLPHGAHVGDTGGTAPRTTRPPRADTGRSWFAAAIASEWWKLRSLRSTLGILVLTAAVAAALVVGLTQAAPDTAPTVADALAFPVVFAAIFAAVAGVSLFTGEVQHRTIEPTLIAQPRRGVVAGAKVVAAATYGVSIAIVGQLAGSIAGLATGTAIGGAGRIVEQAVWAAGFAGLAALLGLGVGMATRHSVGAISALLVWWLVVENLAVTLAPARVARMLPFVAGNGMVGIEMDSPDGALADLVLSRTENAGILAVYVATALLIGVLGVVHRDVE